MSQRHPFFFLLTNNETREKLDGRKLNEDILTFYPNVLCHAVLLVKCRIIFKIIFH